MDSDSRHLPLPKGWPNGVKTAVLHVIALAHAAIVHARGMVVSSPDARTRRLGDLDGLAEEISLLEEELRIKDARTIGRLNAWRFSNLEPHAAGRKRRRRGTAL